MFIFDVDLATPDQQRGKTGNVGRFLLGFRALFAVWTNAASAERVRAALEPQPAPEALPSPAAKEPPAPTPTPKPQRSDALTLLAALQREARLVDFLMEPIGEYTDQQIGAAVRDVHRDSAAVIRRMFEVVPASEAAEGSSIEVPAGFSAHHFQLTGNVTGTGPYRGTVRHHGWRATRCEIPAWTGDANASMIVAPVEVEIG